MTYRFEIVADCSPDCAADLLAFVNQRLADEDGRLLSFVADHEHHELQTAPLLGERSE